MSFLKHRFSQRIVSVPTTLLLCLSLITAATQKGVAKGLLTRKPSVELQSSTTKITYPCPPGFLSSSPSCPATPNFQVR